MFVFTSYFTLKIEQYLINITQMWMKQTLSLKQTRIKNVKRETTTDAFC